jgi:crotonobetainyl-CoA:carnitine CoA-transferase CaiB-like acyl-CoA transferase
MPALADGPLAGLRVLDLSWGIAGPMTAMLLADSGADVTKIEPPGGDPFRAQLGYRVWQRGKRSAVLDLKQASDRAAFLALARHADVLVESFAPGTTAGLGIDFAALSAESPRLVYCSITGYGRDNPHSDRPGYDSLVAARTGLHFEQRGWLEGALNHMARRPDPFAHLEHDWQSVQGPPRPGPVFPASFYPSLGAFFAATLGIHAALRAREITGRGQWVETSLLQGALACASGVWQRAERVDAKDFDSWILCARSPKGHFECSDGRWIHNWVPNPRFLLSASAGTSLNATPALAAKQDPDRFGTGPGELVVMQHYQPLLAEAVRKFPAEEWVRAAATANMTIQAVRSPEESLADPLLLADGCVAEVRDPELGVIRQLGSVIRLAAHAPRIGAPPAPPGEHTDAVRAEAAALAAQPAPAVKLGRKLRAPLEGITVLDLGLAIAGPFGTQLLSDLGANVIKINALYDIYWHANHIAYMANRGKRSLALDLKDARALRVLHQLVARADVVQHNMRYDAAERLGVDYASLRRVNPHLVYCHTRGFENGARAHLPGNDQTGGCLAGTQWEDGGMGRGGKPMWSFCSLGDTGNGFLSAIAILQALRHRDRTGEGQFCETSIVYAQLLNTSYAVARPDGAGFARPRTDAGQTGFSATHRLYETRDGWLCVLAPSDEGFGRLARALGAEALAHDPRFASAAARAKHDAELAQRLAERFAALSAREAFAALDAAGVPCEICDPEFALGLHDDAGLRARGWTVSYPHPFVGKLDQIGLLCDLSDTPGRVQGPPLVVGQHSREILAELGYTADETDALCASCVLDWQPGKPHRVVIPSKWLPKPPAPADDA